MKAIHNKVNIVPVIAKADTLTLKERERLKKRVSAGRGVRREGREEGTNGMWGEEFGGGFSATWNTDVSSLCILASPRLLGYYYL